MKCRQRICSDDCILSLIDNIKGDLRIFIRKIIQKFKLRWFKEFVEHDLRFFVFWWLESDDIRNDSSGRVFFSEKCTFLIHFGHVSGLCHTCKEDERQFMLSKLFFGLVIFLPSNCEHFFCATFLKVFAVPKRFIVFNISMKKSLC